MTTNVPSKPVEFPLDLIVSSEDNPRVELTELDALETSIKAFGVLQPLVVRPMPGGSTLYEIVAGHRRYAAAHQAGLKTVPCVLRETKGDLMRHHLIENTQRVDLTPYEIGISVYCSIENGIKQKELAGQLGKSEAWISKFRAIGEAADTVETGTLELADLVNCTDSEKCYQLARQILGLDGKVSKTKGKSEKQAELTLPDSIDQVLAMRALDKKCGTVGEIEEDVPGEFAVTMIFKNEEEAIRFFSK